MKIRKQNTKMKIHGFLHDSGFEPDGCLPIMKEGKTYYLGHRDGPEAIISEDVESLHKANRLTFFPEPVEGIHSSICVAIPKKLSLNEITAGFIETDKYFVKITDCKEAVRILDNVAIILCDRMEELLRTKGDLKLAEKYNFSALCAARSSDVRMRVFLDLAFIENQKEKGTPLDLIWDFHVKFEFKKMKKEQFKEMLIAKWKQINAPNVYCNCEDKTMSADNKQLKRGTNC